MSEMTPREDLLIVTPNLQEIYFRINQQSIYELASYYCLALQNNLKPTSNAKPKLNQAKIHFCNKMVNRDRKNIPDC